MTTTIRALILIAIISIIKNGISTDNEQPKPPEDIEIITENSLIPNDTTKYELKAKDIKIYKYLLNKGTKCTEVKQINKIEDPLDPNHTVIQHLTIWKYDSSKHKGKYPLSFSYTMNDELVVDYGHECDIYLMFEGKWHFYGTGNIKTGKITNRKIRPEITNTIIGITFSVLTLVLIILNFIMIAIISRLYKTITQVKLSIDKSENGKLLM